MSEIQFAKTIRLAVTGDVRLTALEVAIIDTPAFQRLRQIKQLGPSVWVYPTALHTRFDHSIGVLATADLMVESIRDARRHVRAEYASQACEITEKQQKLARLYGLLHDITHAPFGHTLEDELKVFGSHDAFQEGGKSSPRFEEPLGAGSAIGRLIKEHEGAEFYNRFRNIVLKGKTARLSAKDDGKDTADEFIYHLVSDTVCADLIDYLQRDSHFCNLGLRAPVRVMNYLYVTDVEQPSGELLRRVVIRLWKTRGGGHGDGRPRRDILTDLAGLLDSRYMLAERVYFHPAKLIVGSMIGRAALEAKRAGHLDELKLVNFGDDTFLDYLKRLPDLPALQETGDETAEHAALASRLAVDVLNRSLYKRVHRYHEEDFSETAEDHLPAKETLHSMLSDAEDRALHEDEIANVAGVPAGNVLIYVGPKKMNMKVADAIIDWRGSRKRLSELTEHDDRVLVDRLRSIQNSHLRLWVVDLLVHPSVTNAQREVIASAFEAKFLPKKDRRAKWVDVLTYLAAMEPVGNFSHQQVNDACRAAAHHLSEREPGEIPAHGQTARERLVSIIKEHLHPSESDG